MLEEIEVELWTGDNLKKEPGKLNPLYAIMEDLSRYAIFDRQNVDREYWEGRVLCNNAAISIMETSKKDSSFHLAVTFAYLKSTLPEDLEPVRAVFSKHGLEGVKENCCKGVC